MTGGPESSAGGVVDGWLGGTVVAGADVTGAVVGATAPVGSAAVADGSVALEDGVGAEDDVGAEAVEAGAIVVMVWGGADVVSGVAGGVDELPGTAEPSRVNASALGVDGAVELLRELSTLPGGVGASATSVLSVLAAAEIVAVTPT